MLNKIFGTSLLLSASYIAVADQYNHSLSYEPLTTSNGIITTQPAANVDMAWDVATQAVTEVTEGVFRLSGWGIGNIIAIEGVQGWIIIDAGDSVSVAKAQRAALEQKLGQQIEVEAILYTHSHYVWGASVWQDERTKVYGHEWLEKHLMADNGVSPLAGNFNARAVLQFGMLHPAQGADAFPNKLGFSLDKLSDEKGYLSPDITFTNGQIETHKIAGLTVNVLPSPTDVTDSVAFYIPKKSLMVTNALNGDNTIFNLYTLRGDRYRDPNRLVAAADLVLSYDFEHHIDIHGPANTTAEAARHSIEAFRDSMQLIHDQTIRAISLGKDAQGAAEFLYMPENMRLGKETYGQVESHVKQVYNGTMGWNGWDIYDINPLRTHDFSKQYISSLGGIDSAVKMVKQSNEKQTVKGWQWSLYLTSQLIELAPNSAEVKQLRAEAARALGQRTTSANARGFYISEALLHEGKLVLGDQVIADYASLSQMLGAMDKQKLAQSPIENNVNYLRYLVDPRKAEGLTAQFNLKMSDNSGEFGIALRNGIIQVGEPTVEAVTLSLSHSQWGSVLLGSVTFGELDASLEAFDKALTIQSKELR